MVVPLLMLAQTRGRDPFPTPSANPPGQSRHEMDSVISSDLLTTDLSLLPVRAPPEPLPRIIRIDDLEPLARLYLTSYPSGIGAGNHVEATSEIVATLEGDYGVLRPGVSLMTEAGSRPVGAVLTVKRSIWGEGLEGPFIIDLFVDP